MIGECEINNNQDNIYELKTKFGARDNEEYELIGRTILDEMYNTEKI